MHRIEKIPNIGGFFGEVPPNRTPVGADWLNAVQEEIAYVIEQAGLTLKLASTETRQQLKEAIDIQARVGYTATITEINEACDLSVNAFHAPGRKIYLYEDVAPTGWTIEGVADRVLAVKGGAQAYNVAGGTQAGSWTQPNHTLVEGEVPAHTHGTTGDHTHTSAFVTGTDSKTGYNLASTSSAAGDINHPTTSNGDHAHANFGGGGAHNHGTTYRPYAAVGIIVSRD